MNIDHAVNLRPVVQLDIPLLEGVATRAFNSSEIGVELRSMLTLYCKRGLDNIPLSEQEDEALPRQYFAIVLQRQTEYEVVGITGLYRLGTWTWKGILWLGWTAVDSALQGQGIGTAALGDIVNLAASLGAERLKVETAYNGRATRFYLRNGFAEEARLAAHYAPDLDALVLSRSLTDL